MIKKEGFENYDKTELKNMLERHVIIMRSANILPTSKYFPLIMETFMKFLPMASYLGMEEIEKELAHYLVEFLDEKNDKFKDKPFY